MTAIAKKHFQIEVRIVRVSRHINRYKSNVNKNYCYYYYFIAYLIHKKIKQERLSIQ